MISRQMVNSSADLCADVMCASGDLPKARWCSKEAMMPSGRIADSSMYISSCRKHMLAARPAIAGNHSDVLSQQ